MTIPPHLNLLVCCERYYFITYSTHGSKGVSNGFAKVKNALSVLLGSFVLDE